MYCCSFSAASVGVLSIWVCLGRLHFGSILIFLGLLQTSVNFIIERYDYKYVCQQTFFHNYAEMMRRHLIM